MQLDKDSTCCAGNRISSPIVTILHSKEHYCSMMMASLGGRGSLELSMELWMELVELFCRAIEKIVSKQKMSCSHRNLPSAKGQAL